LNRHLVCADCLDELNGRKRILLDITKSAGYDIGTQYMNGFTK